MRVIASWFDADANALNRGGIGATSRDVQHIQSSVCPRNPASRTAAVDNLELQS